MKRFLFLILLSLSYVWGDAQVVVQRAGAANTVNDPRHMASLNSFQPRYQDTTAANGQKGIDSSGALIYTYDVGGFWIRQHAPKRWVRLADETNIEALVHNTQNNVTALNDSTLVVCATTGLCDTLTVATTIQNISLTEYLTDTTIRICGTGGCDTLVVPRPVLYRFQNGLVMGGPDSTLIEWGGYLEHNTTLYAAGYVATLAGAVVHDYPYQFRQYQGASSATGMTSFQSAGGHVAVPDYQNQVRLGINYTSSDYSPLDGNPGYLGDKIGYWLGVNTTGNGAFGLRDDDDSAKVAGVFFHTLDRSYSDAVTLFGAAPKDATGYRGQLDTARIATFHTDKHLTLYGYPSSRNDGVLSKVLGTDAEGNVLLGTIGAYSTTDTSGRTYYALNGLGARNDSTFALGGYLDQTTRIKGNNTYFLSLDSLSGFYTRTYTSDYEMYGVQQGDTYSMTQTYLAGSQVRNRFYWNTQRMYFENYVGAYSFANVPAQSMGNLHRVLAIDQNDLIYKVSGLPEFTDNAAALAAGLTAGDWYRTADGTVKIVYAP